jgi:serpin B
MSQSPFEGALTAELGRTQTGNFVVSPASVALGLAMTREGACGETAAQLDRVLGASARETAKVLLQQFERASAGAPLLAIANRLFCDRSLELVQAFADLTERDYGARVKTLDFRGKANASRVHINGWVAHATREKIRDLLSPSAITALTRLVLVDAVYLKAAWHKPFDADLTGPAAFAVAGGTSTQVPTMHGVVDVRWGVHAGAHVLDLPYANTGTPELGMLVVVPDGRSLADVEDAYAHEGLAPYRAALTGSGSTSLAMPRFEARTNLDLAEPLARLGLEHPFGEASDFSGIATNMPIAISNVMHQAWIAVGEAGTEAAAATAAVMRERGRGPRIVHEFAVDRSFLFFVHDAADNALFGGRVLDPLAL